MSLIEQMMEKISERRSYVDFIVSGECPKIKAETLLQQISKLETDIDGLSKAAPSEKLKNKRRKRVEFESKINGKHYR